MGSALTSPWQYVTVDGNGHGLTFTIAFNNSTLVITGCTAVRDPASPWSTVYFGLGPDGTPQTSPASFAVPVGTTQVTKAQMQARGFTTMTDVFAGQITAAP